MPQDLDQHCRASDDEADVDVLIVNYKTARLTVEAAQSVLYDPCVRSVVIVDNASGDGSARQLSERLAKHDGGVQIIESKINLGFGGGNNLGAQAAEGKYLFLLNSDATAKSGCIGKLRELLQGNPRIGLAAPAVLLEETGKLQPGTHGVFPTPYALLTRKTTASDPQDLEPDWISGVALLARRAEYQALGGFDETLFMYYEDVDLCRRYRQRGFCVAREPKACVVHKLGQSGLGDPRHKAVYYQGQERYLELAGYSRITRLALAGARSVFNARARSRGSR